MPTLQELPLQRPEMANDYFHLEKDGPLFQKWEYSFLGDEPIEFYLEEQEAWITGKVQRVYIDDASGNAPGADAHFRAIWTDEGGSWRIDLHEGLKVRYLAPTDEELIASSKWCEGYDWGWHPSEDQRCYEQGKEYVYPSGSHVWYCDKHKPKDAIEVVVSHAG